MFPVPSASTSLIKIRCELLNSIVPSAIISVIKPCPIGKYLDGVLVPSGSGTVISNVVFRGVYNNSGRYQVGYFSTATTTLAQMGFTNGVVLTSGNTSGIPLTLGVDPRSVAQMATGYTSCTPGEIRQGGSCPAGINDLDILAGAQNYFNASVLEFDFVPVENSVQFRYIFGSEEYSDDSGFINYQCSSFNDKFGFLISGPGIAGGQGYTNDARNIARLGNGSEVSINSVNNGVVGSSGGAPNAANCTFANGDWIQNTPTPEYLGTIDGTQLNGNTRILTATQTGLIPGQTYHIKLIVTDVNDGTYDSVVYLEAGSFTTEFSCNAGPNQELCDVTSTTLAASSPATGTWSVISGSGTFVSNTDPNTVVNGLSSGNNVFRWTASDLSCSADVVITVNNSPNAGTNGTLTVCQGTTPTNAELFAALNGTPDAGGSWSNVGLVYTYTVTGVAPCPNATATVTLIEIQFPNFQIESGCVDLEYTLSVSPYDLNYTYNWFDSNNNLIGNNEFIIINEADTYTLEVVSSNCSISSFITIDNVFCSIPKGLSPNGDGLNDTWDLSNLDVREVKIFNRYGLEVYQQNNYTNQWDGRDMKGNELPTATYYYVITFESGKQKTGWVYLQRVK